MDLPPKARRTIVELLQPLVTDSAQRQSFVTSTLHMTNIPQQIDYSGSSEAFAERLLTRVLDYGTVDSQPAVILLLDGIAERVGQNHQQTLAVIREIAETSAPIQPTNAPLSSVQGGTPEIPLLQVIIGVVTVLFLPLLIATLGNVPAAGQFWLIFLAVTLGLGIIFVAFSFSASARAAIRQRAALYISGFAVLVGIVVPWLALVTASAFAGTSVYSNTDATATQANIQTQASIVNATASAALAQATELAVTLDAAATRDAEVNATLTAVAVTQAFFDQVQTELAPFE